jgi:hypothetical protein
VTSHAFRSYLMEDDGIVERKQAADFVPEPRGGETRDGEQNQRHVQLDRLSSAFCNADTGAADKGFGLASSGWSRTWLSEGSIRM